MDFDALENIWLLALATSSMSITLTKSSMANWLRPKLPLWMQALFSCPYCVSHWIALFLTWHYFPELHPFPVSFFVAWFAVVAMAAVVSCIIGLLMKVSK